MAFKNIDAIKTTASQTIEATISEKHLLSGPKKDINRVNVPRKKRRAMAPKTPHPAILVREAGSEKRMLRRATTGKVITIPAYSGNPFLAVNMTSATRLPPAANPVR